MLTSSASGGSRDAHHRLSRRGIVFLAMASGLVAGMLLTTGLASVSGVLAAPEQAAKLRLELTAAIANGQELQRSATQSQSRADAARQWQEVAMAKQQELTRIASALDEVAALNENAMILSRAMPELKTPAYRDPYNKLVHALAEARDRAARAGTGTTKQP